MADVYPEPGKFYPRAWLMGDDPLSYGNKSCWITHSNLDFK